MAYRITLADRTLTQALRRIALEQIDAALADLPDGQALSRDIIHDLRKRCKKLRGLLWLVHDGLPDAHAEDHAIRDLARLLSGNRDTMVLAQTHAALSGQAASDRALPVSPKVAEGFRALRARATAWTVAGDDAETLRKGLYHVAHRMARARKAARDRPGPGTLHEWRKWAKYHWYHTRLMQDANPRVLRPRREAARVLSELLGQHHDLAVYIDALPDRRGDLRDRARREQAERAAEAFRLGKSLARPKSRKLARKWVKWWDQSRC